ILSEVRRRADEGGAKAIAFGHLPDEDARELLEIDSSLLPLHVESDCTLDVPVSFDAYLESMRAKMRKNAKRALRGFELAGYRIEPRTLSDILDPAARIVALHEQKYGVPIDAAFARGWLKTLADLFDTRAFCIFSGDRMVGV